MKRIRFLNKPSALVVFTRQDVEILNLLSSTHYDGHCQSFSKPGRLIHRLKNRLKWSEHPDNLHPEPGTGEIALTFRDVDTLAKIVENPHPRADRGIQTALMLGLGQTLAALSNEYSRINTKETP